MDQKKKREQEQQVVRQIIGIYCRGHRHDRLRGEWLCPDCQQLADYAAARIQHCPRMEQKTFCSVCPIHCYAPLQQEQILRVMRYGGPRMLLHHPVMALRHMLLGWRDRHN